MPDETRPPEIVWGHETGRPQPGRSITPTNRKEARMFWKTWFGKKDVQELREKGAQNKFAEEFLTRPVAKVPGVCPTCQAGVSRLRRESGGVRLGLATSDVFMVVFCTNCKRTHRLEGESIDVRDVALRIINNPPVDRPVDVRDRTINLSIGSGNVLYKRGLIQIGVGRFESTDQFDPRATDVKPDGRTPDFLVTICSDWVLDHIPIPCPLCLERESKRGVPLVLTPHGRVVSSVSLQMIPSLDFGMDGRTGFCPICTMSNGGNNNERKN